MEDAAVKSNFKEVFIMLKKQTIGIVCILLIIVLLCAGCADSGSIAKPEGITDLPQYAELSSLIGLRKEDALNKWGGRTQI